MPPLTTEVISGTFLYEIGNRHLVSLALAGPIGPPVLLSYTDPANPTMLLSGSYTVVFELILPAGVIADRINLVAGKINVATFIRLINSPTTPYQTKIRAAGYFEAGTALSLGFILVFDGTKPQAALNVNGTITGRAVLLG